MNILIFNTDKIQTVGGRVALTTQFILFPLSPGIVYVVLFSANARYVE